GRRPAPDPLPCSWRFLSLGRFGTSIFFEPERLNTSWTQPTTATPPPWAGDPCVPGGRVYHPRVEASLRLLGSPAVHLPEGARDLPVDKPASLLYYLASRGDWVTRSELAYLYRPDAPEEVALGNVRVLLHRARSRGWPGELVVEKARLRYDVDTDLGAFRSAAAGADWETALDLYRGEFLAGVELHDAPAYGSWLDAERADLGRQWRLAVPGQATRLRRAEERRVGR